MDIDIVELRELRDWVIVVWGSIGALATIILTILLIIIFRKLSRVLDAAKETAENVRKTSSVVSQNVIQPIAKIQGFVTGLRKAVDAVTSMSKKGGEKNGD